MRDDIKANAGPIVLGVTFLAGLAWIAATSCGCAGAVESHEAAVDSGSVPWCARLEPVQVSCAIDALLACEERNGRQPSEAHACGTYAATACVGFDSGCAGVIVYCCN